MSEFLLLKLLNVGLQQVAVSSSDPILPFQVIIQFLCIVTLFQTHNDYIC